MIKHFNKLIIFSVINLYFGNVCSFSSSEIQINRQQGFEHFQPTTYFSPAKLNLYLKILGKDENGYHNLSTLMHTINLYDYITFAINDSDGDILSITHKIHKHKHHKIDNLFTSDETTILSTHLRNINNKTERLDIFQHQTQSRYNNNNNSKYTDIYNNDYRNSNKDQDSDNFDNNSNKDQDSDNFDNNSNNDNAIDIHQDNNSNKNNNSNKTGNNNKNDEISNHKIIFDSNYTIQKYSYGTVKNKSTHNHSSQTNKNADYTYTEKKDNPSTNIYTNDSCSTNTQIYNDHPIKSHYLPHITLHPRNEVGIPRDNSNLILQAIEELRKYTYVPPLNITLNKNIPLQAGLGGGSSNAATTLFAINELLNKPFSQIQLSYIASKLGADVPFFLSRGFAHCTGYGELIEAKFLDENGFLSQHKYVYIFKPNFGLSTKSVFENLNLGTLSDTPEEEDILEFLVNDKTLYIETPFFNDLENSAFELQPNLKSLYNKLQAHFHYISMTGSGSTLFAVGERFKNLDKRFDELKNEFNLKCFRCQFITRDINSDWYGYQNECTEL